MLFERRSNAVLFFVCVEKPNAFVLDFSQFDFSVSFWKNGFFVLRIIHRIENRMLTFLLSR